MRNNVKNIISTILVFVLVVGCFAALPLTTSAAPAPVSGNPDWKADYSKNANVGHPESKLWDRGNAAGDKITSNAHSADWEGVYFYWDDKQKEDGVFLVCDWVFDLFADSYTHVESGISFGKGDSGFVLTAKNSNNYWGYKIARSTGKVIDTVDGVNIWAFAIPKQFQYLDNKGKTVTESLKNINMVFIDGNYKSAWVLLTKSWLDETGKPLYLGDWRELNEQLKFNDGAFKLGINEEDFCEIKVTDFVTAQKGKDVTITETEMPDGFAFMDAYVLSGCKLSKTATNGITLTLKPGDKAAVLFENQKQKATITIEKLWIDADGNDAEAPEGVEAIFDIYEYAADADGSLGTLVIKGAVPGEQYKIKAGMYVIVERPKDGYVEQPNQIIRVEANKNHKFTFINEPTIDQTASLSFEKKVEGKNIKEWLLDTYAHDLDRALIPAGLSFWLKNADNSYGPATLDDNGEVHFENVKPGTYILSEEITGRAVGIFKEMVDIEITIAEGNNNYFILGGAVKGVIEGVNIKEDDLFIIVNGYNSPKHLTGLGYTGLTNGGDLFYIGVTSKATGITYASFCAHGGSKNFAGESNRDCDGYLIVQKADMDKLENPEMETSYDAILAALNWIEHNVGDLTVTDGPYGLVTTQRVVAQTVIWALLGNIDVNSDKFSQTNLTNDERAFVMGALEAAENGCKGRIVDLVYMVCEKHHEFETCQPQLVPIFGTFYVENKLADTVDIDGSISVSVEIEVERDVAIWEPVYKFESLGDKTIVTRQDNGIIFNDESKSDGKDNSGMTYIKVDLADFPIGVPKEYQLANANKNKDQPYEHYYYLTLNEDYTMTISFEESLKSITYGILYKAEEFDSRPTSELKVNLHDADYNFVVPADVFYLYVHVKGSETEWWTSEIDTWVSSGETYTESVEYNGDLTLTVTGPDGFKEDRTATYPDDIDDGVLFSLNKLAIGEYILTLSGEDFDDITTEPVTVSKENSDIPVTFDGILITLPPIVSLQEYLDWLATRYTVS